MTLFYRGDFYYGITADDASYSKLASSGFMREVSSKPAVLAKLLSVSNDLPVGTIVKIEKIYRMSKGYEPNKPRTGSVLDTAYLKLKQHGAWYDPKTGKARPAKWVKATDAELAVRSLPRRSFEEMNK